MNTRKNNTIVVTGGSGFIGSHLLKALGSRGKNYDILDYNENTESNILDVSNFERFIKIHAPKCIIHLAAISSLDASTLMPNKALEVNILGTYNVLSVAKKYGIKTILASSAAATMPEMSLYGASKLAMEKIAALFNNVIVVRMFNVYGTGSQSVVTKFLKAAIHDHPVFLNGVTTRDYIYIDDVVKAFIDLADNVTPNGEIIQIGSRIGTTLLELVTVIESALMTKLKKVQLDPIREIPISMCMFKSKYYSVSLADGIAKMIKDLKE